MNEIIDILVKSGTLLLVAISTGLAIRIYYRNKRIELENSLFKSRLEAIGNIQMELAIFMQQIDRAKVILSEVDNHSSEELNRMALEFDEKIYTCEASIIKYAAYFSDNTSNILIQFAENFYDQHNGIAEELLIGLNTYEEYVRKNAKEVINHLRLEAGLEDVHKTLMTRIDRSRSQSTKR